VDLNKNCSEYTQGKVDSDNVEIRYSTRRRHQIPSGPVHIDDTAVIPVSVVRDLGVYIESISTAASP